MGGDRRGGAAVSGVGVTLSLGIDLESYRERLTPLAVAVLSGESRRTIDKRRELVLPVARADLEQPVRKSKLARHVVDCVLADLLDNNDQNIAALEALERELESLPPSDRTSRAAIAARGAFVAARIPPNELRAAIVRSARSADAYGLERAGSAEHGAVLLAQALATDTRRAAVRQWARLFAEGSAEHVPLLAEHLQALAVESESTDAGSDLIWIQACLGLTMEVGLSMS